MKILRTIQVLQTSGEQHDDTFSQLKAARAPQIKTQKTEMNQTQPTFEERKLFVFL